MEKVKFMRKCRNSTHEADKKLFRYSGENPKGKREFWVLRCRWENNNKTNLKDM